MGRSVLELVIELFVGDVDVLGGSDAVDNQFRFHIVGSAQQVVSVPVPPGAQIVLEPGVPDTPMAFGNNAPVYIGNVGGGPPIMKFRSTGAFTDPNYAPLNGTIFVGLPNQAFTARAVTIMGGTGRVRPYTWTGAAWIE